VTVPHTARRKLPSETTPKGRVKPEWWRRRVCEGCSTPPATLQSRGSRPIRQWTIAFASQGGARRFARESMVGGGLCAG
jgi:hypothetical protein